MRKPKMLPLQFPYAPGSTTGVVGSLDTCSARVSRKFSEAIFAHVSRSAQGRFIGDGGRLGGVFQKKFKLDYGNTQ